VRRKRHKRDIVILPSVRRVPLEYKPEAGRMFRHNGDMGIGKLGIACVAYWKRGIRAIVNGFLKVFEKTDSDVMMIRIRGPCEIGSGVIRR
jgi:hypothetical protein